VHEDDDGSITGSARRIDIEALRFVVAMGDADRENAVVRQYGVLRGPLSFVFARWL
jgi:hypothetical protein